MNWPTQWQETEMGAQLKYGTAGATGGGWSSIPGALQPAYEELRHEPKWDWQNRAPKTNKDKSKWTSLWSWGCRIGYGMPSGNDGVTTNRDLSAGDLFEPYSCDGNGTQSVRFLLGTCVDASDVAVANAIVQAFRTSDDLYLGEVQANTDGTYGVGIQVAAGTPCYLVAYKPGTPDIAGTTVNTLTPTNVDGT
jgi:hypothetical protein